MRLKTITILAVATSLVTVQAATTVADDTVDAKIARAVSAAPAAVSGKATVMDSDGTMLRKGSNGWTCMTEVMAGDGAAVCIDATWGEMMAELGGDLYYPRIEFCTDNGAMIAQAGCLRLVAGEVQPLEIDARARWSMQELKAL